MNIFVTGSTSSSRDAMEYHNLGNYVIVDPMFDLLRQTFPETEISTSIQMSDEFNARFDLRSCHQKRFWSYGVITGLSTAVDIIRIFLWRLTGIKKLLSSPLLQEIIHADLVIDFSGDIYGDNANWRRFLETNARLLFAFTLKKKTAMIIGSPGPFSSFWRRWIARKVLPRLDLLTNREPVSTEMLVSLGINNPNLYTTACPSVLFKAADVESLRGSPDYTKLFEQHEPTFGIILCGWNMPVGPFNRWPREDWEFEPFVHLINFILSNTRYRVCLMSHQNATSPDGHLQRGNDHRIIDRLIGLLGEKYDGERVFTLSGLYNAAESRTIISTFDLMMSGRIHGAVQGLSQCIPTAIIDYGHKPKAHKLLGFARVYGVEDFLCDPTSSSEIVKAASKLIEERENIKTQLQNRVESVKKAALFNFSLLKNLAEEKK